MGRKLKREEKLMKKKKVKKEHWCATPVGQNDEISVNNRRDDNVIDCLVWLAIDDRAGETVNSGEKASSQRNLFLRAGKNGDWRLARRKMRSSGDAKQH